MVTLMLLYHNNGLYIRSFDYRIQTTATCWYGRFFPLTQEQNVPASWTSAAVFCKVFKCNFWPRHMRHESVFVAATSLTLFGVSLAFALMVVLDEKS